MSIFSVGSTFLNKPAGSVPSHLWVVVSDPARNPDQVVIVNLTSKNMDSDCACILDAGDHPFIQHETVVYYERAKCTTLAVLQSAEAAGLLHVREDCEPYVLRRIWKGFAASSHAQPRILDVLRAQSLI